MLQSKAAKRLLVPARHGEHAVSRLAWTCVHSVPCTPPAAARIFLSFFQGVSRHTTGVRQSLISRFEPLAGHTQRQCRRWDVLMSAMTYSASCCSCLRAYALLAVGRINASASLPRRLNEQKQYHSNPLAMEANQTLCKPCAPRTLNPKPNTQNPRCIFLCVDMTQNPRCIFLYVHIHTRLKDRSTSKTRISSA